MYQRNVRFEVLHGDYERYCLQGTREDAESTSKLTEYMPSHKRAVFSTTESLCIPDQLEVVFVGSEGTIVSLANLLNVHMHLLQVLAIDLLAPQVGEVVFEDNFSLLQDKLHKSVLYDVLGWYLELQKYCNLPSATFETFLKLIMDIPNIPTMVSLLQIIMRDPVTVISTNVIISFLLYFI
jgi:hypothetical protein